MVIGRNRALCNMYTEIGRKISNALGNGMKHTSIIKTTITHAKKKIAGQFGGKLQLT